MFTYMIYDMFQDQYDDQEEGFWKTIKKKKGPFQKF